MKPINLLLLGIGGYLIYQWYQKNQATIAPSISSITSNPSLLPGVSVSVPETTGVAQIVPTPSSILPLALATGTPSPCGACSNCSQMSGIKQHKYII